MTSPATKPSVEIPDGPPPTELVVEDLSVGDGPEATSGTTCTMQYVGVAWSTGPSPTPRPFEGRRAHAQTPGATCDNTW